MWTIRFPQRPFVIAIVLTLLLSSCANQARLYTEPTIGETATLSIQANISGQYNTVGVVLLRGDEVRESSGDVLYAASESGAVRTGRTNYRIEANKEFRFLVRFTLITVGPSPQVNMRRHRVKWCLQHKSFEPRSEGQYIIKVDIDDQNCTVGVLSRSADGSVLSEPSVIELRGCYDKSQYAGWVPDEIKDNFCSEGFHFRPSVSR